MKASGIVTNNNNTKTQAIPMSVLGLLILLCMSGYCSTVYALHPITSTTDLISQYPVYPKVNYAKGNSGAVRRGEYLVKIGDCIACHTDSDNGGQAFAGGLPIPTPFGTFYTPNITPDKETGVGNWTEADFIRAMREGVLADGSNAFPAFPYVYFNRVLEQDLKDIWAYLSAIPAVSHKNRGNTLPFPLNVRLFQYGWKWLYFYPDEGEFSPRPDKSKHWNRGAYLVEGLGHCTMCHTPMNLIGAEQKQYYLTGAFVQGYWAPDITRRGLSSASRYQVANVFLKGELINHAGKVRGPMADANHDSLRHLIRFDRLAIAEYLKSIDSHQPRNIPEEKAKQAPIKRGHQVYANVCVMCHLNGEVGAPRVGDQADWLVRIRQSGLNGLYRHAVQGFNKMPVQGACVTCTEQEVTDAVDYILYHSLEHSQWTAFQKRSILVQPASMLKINGEKIYRQNCSICHETGKLNAPVTGNIQQWAPLLRKNFELLIENTYSGINNMPPKGGCRYCTGSEIKAAVKYMAQQSQAGGYDYSLW